MPDIPADAPRSPDGNYWWDGSAWQLVTTDAAGSAGSQDAVAGAAPEEQGKLEHQWGEAVQDQVEVPEMDETGGEGTMA
jgi:hypothetical protein